MISDYLHLDSASTFTYASSTGTTSWLDHAISTASMHSLITHISVDYASCVTSDHLPISFVLNIHPEQVAVADEDEYQPTRSAIKWDTLKDEDFAGYHTKSDANLTAVNIEHELALCQDTTCKNSAHITSINILYQDLIGALMKASEGLGWTSKHHNQIPGWNDYLKRAT